MPLHEIRDRGSTPASPVLPSILVSVINTGWVRSELSLWVTRQIGDRLATGYDPIVNNNLDAARNRQVKRFLEQDFTHLLLVDSDTVPPDDVIPRLLRHDKPVIGWAVQNWVGGLELLQTYTLKELPDRGDGRYWYQRVSGEGLMECDATGAACLLVRREVFEAIEPPWFQTQHSSDGTEVWLGEDVYFSRKVRQAGYSIHVDCSGVASHMKTVDLAALNAVLVQLLPERTGANACRGGSSPQTILQSIPWPASR